MLFPRRTTSTLRPLVFAVLIGGLSLAGVAPAVVVEDLFDATVEIQPGTANVRALAQSAGLAQVLVRITGNRLAAMAPELLPLLESPDRYVAQYGLSSATQATVRFIPSVVERAVQDAGWPIWGAERPLSMLWIAVTDQFGEQAVVSARGLPASSTLGDHIREIVRRVGEDVESVAQSRGLPVVLPEFFAQDDMNLVFSQIWNYSFDSLYELSLAHGADAIVIGRIRESVIGTDVEWFLRSRTVQMTLPGSGLPEGIHWAADAFAEQYRSIGGRQPVTLRISGVNDFDSYARVLAYLESLTILSSVDVESYRGGELLLRAVSRGDAQVLVRTFGLDSVLRERGIPVPSAASAIIDLIVVPERRVFSGFDPDF
jgi:hypothetical protein